MPRTFAPGEDVDVVVVGTGAAGGPVLSVLAAAGLRVLALEAGSRVGVGEMTGDEQLAAQTINWLDERRSGGADPTAFGANNSGRGVGGSTLHWGAFAPRPAAAQLRLRSEHGVGQDWPVAHDELVEHIVAVERFVGVAGPAHYPWDPDRRYELPPPARNTSAQLMIDACTALGVGATDAPAAVLTRPWTDTAFGARDACVNCGRCHQGCRNSAKASTEVTYLPHAVAHGAEIRDNATVIGLQRDGAGRVTSVIYRRDGVDHRQRCAAVFLCGGGVETPRLLLHTGLANSSGQVGRNFMVHGGVQAWGRFDTPLRHHRGYPSAAITEDFARPADAGFASGYLIQSLGVMPSTYATSLVRGGLWGAELVRALQDYRYMAGLGINGECLPAEGNDLRLSDDYAPDGLPVVEARFSAGDNERAIDEHAVARMTEILQTAGARDIRVLPRTAHTLGTCRMGADADTSVVGPQGRSWDVENLWICDTSTFPSSLVANPALTTMALARRSAMAFLAAR